MPYFFFLHVECSKAFDARCVDNVAVTRHGKHLGKSSGVHAFVVIGGDCAGFDIQFRKDDYITKPFDMEEVLARIESRIRSI